MEFWFAVTHTEEVTSLSLDTWISLVVLVTALSGFYVALRREFRSEVARLEAHLGGQIMRLDDRVYDLAIRTARVPDDPSH